MPYEDVKNSGALPRIVLGRRLPTINGENLDPSGSDATLLRNIWRLSRCCFQAEQETRPSMQTVLEKLDFMI